MFGQALIPERLMHVFLVCTLSLKKLISRCYKVSMLYVVKIELYSGEVFSLFYGESQKLPPFRLMVKLFGQNSLAILRI